MPVLLPESPTFLKEDTRAEYLSGDPINVHRLTVLSSNVGRVEMARKLPEETRTLMIGLHIGWTKFLVKINKEYAHDDKPWVNQVRNVLCLLLSLQHFHFKPGLRSSICSSNRVLHHRQSWPMYNPEQK